MVQTLLYSGHLLNLCYDHFKCPNSSFFGTHQNLQLWLNFLTMKWYVQTLNRVPQLIKNSKYFKNGVKSSHKPVNHIFLGIILKNFNKPYFQNLPWNLAKMQFKLIFQVSPIPRGRYLRWKSHLMFYRAVGEEEKVEQDEV